MDENKLNKVRGEQEEPRKRVPLTRATFLAIMSMLMTVAVAASLTFALFVNDVKEQHVKIQAGELAIAVNYTKLEGKKIETNPQSPDYGRLVDFTSNASNNTEGVDFGDLDDTAGTETVGAQRHELLGIRDGRDTACRLDVDAFADMFGE